MNLCVSEYMCAHVYSAHGVLKRVLGLLEYYRWCELSRGYLEPNWGLQQEQQVLLPAEPSL